MANKSVKRMKNVWGECIMGYVTKNFDIKTAKLFINKAINNKKRKTFCCHVETTQFVYNFECDRKIFLGDIFPQKPTQFLECGNYHIFLGWKMTSHGLLMDGAISLMTLQELITRLAFVICLSSCLDLRFSTCRKTFFSIKILSDKYAWCVQLHNSNNK